MFDKKSEKEKNEKIAENSEITEKNCMDTDMLKEQSGIWGINLKDTFDTFKQTDQNVEQFNTSIAYVENFECFLQTGQGLLFYGNIGTGKTFTACCIGNTLPEKGFSVYYTNVQDFVDDVTTYNRNLYNRYRNCNRYDRYYENDVNPMDRVKTTDLLIFDDFNTDMYTDYAIDILYNAINNRYIVEKPMIIITNMNAKQMRKAKSLQERAIFDRILQYCYPIKFNGPSMRNYYGAYDARTQINDEFDDFEELEEPDCLLKIIDTEAYGRAFNESRASCSETGK